MTREHAILGIAWAGYLRVPVCRCGWKGLPQKTILQADRAGREHLQSARGTR